jgi:hypothetical protein
VEICRGTFTTQSVWTILQTDCLTNFHKARQTSLAQTSAAAAAAAAQAVCRKRLDMNSNRIQLLVFLEKQSCSSNMEAVISRLPCNTELAWTGQCIKCSMKLYIVWEFVAAPQVPEYA